MRAQHSQTQKGPGIAARPRVAGLLPWPRTDHRHGFGGSSARAGKGMRTLGRSSRLAVVRSSRRRAAVTSLGGPLHRPGRGPELGSLAGRDFLRPIPSEPSTPLARRFRPSGFSGGPFLHSRSRALARRFREPGFRPLSVSSFGFEQRLRATICFRFEPRLRAAFRFCFARRSRAAFHTRFACRLRATLRVRSSRALAFFETSVARGRHFRFATSGASHPRTVSDCGFPKAPAPFPVRVSL
jgi:hypothetical protein